MTNGITDLSVLHEVPYSQIKGDWVKVKQEVNETPSSLEAFTERPEDRREVTIREGNIIGRAEGTGLYYSEEYRDNIPTSIGPAIYLETPEDTILEVRTDKENELLDYQNNE